MVGDGGSVLFSIIKIVKWGRRRTILFVLPQLQDVQFFIAFSFII